MLFTKTQIQIQTQWNSYHLKVYELKAELDAKDEEIFRMAELLRANNINPDPIQGQFLGN